MFFFDGVEFAVWLVVSTSVAFILGVIATSIIYWNDLPRGKHLGIAVRDFLCEYKSLILFPVWVAFVGVVFIYLSTTTFRSAPAHDVTYEKKSTY